MQYNDKVNKAKQSIANAQFILIGGGAGLSDAAGIHYSGKRFNDNFSPFIERYGMKDMYSAGFYPFQTQEEKWAYWSKHILLNRYEPPALQLYKDLFKVVRNKNYFIITTNVDYQFYKAGFSKDRIFAVQGNYGKMQCAIGCHNKLYDNESIIRNMVDTTNNCKIPNDLIPRCPICGGNMEINIRKDIYFVQDEEWHQSYHRYEEFISKALDGKMVLIELGVGFNTPSIIRYPFEQMTYNNENATLIRINKDYPSGMIENEIKTISFDENMGFLLKALNNTEEVSNEYN